MKQSWATLGHMKPLRVLSCFMLMSLLFVSCCGQIIRIPLEKHHVEPHQHYRNYHPQQHSIFSLFSDQRVALTNFYNRMYTGVVSLGVPAQSFNLVFDTGSADLWVFSSHTTGQKYDFINYYDDTQSNTAVPIVPKRFWNIQYGKGSASGYLIQDTVKLGNISASHFIFAQATAYSSDFIDSDLPLDGIAGFAYQSMSKSRTPPLVDALYNAGLIQSRMFSFYLTSDNPKGSQFVLGAPDPSLANANSNITYFNLATTSGDWTLAMQGMVIGGVSTPYCSSTNECAILLDTGTSFIGIASAFWNSFVSRVTANRIDCQPSTSGIIVCTDPNSRMLPDIKFQIQGSSFTLKGSDYFDSYTKVLGFMSIDIASSNGDPFFILGDTFLKTYYSVFDMDNRAIGIVNAAPGLPYTPPSDSSPTVNWRMIAFIAGAVIAVGILAIAIIGYRHVQRRRQSPPPAFAGGGPGYVLGSRPNAPAVQMQEQQFSSLYPQPYPQQVLRYQPNSPYPVIASSVPPPHPVLSQPPNQARIHLPPQSGTYAMPPPGQGQHYYAGSPNTV